jgi:hypothetical protein
MSPTWRVLALKLNRPPRGLGSLIVSHPGRDSEMLSEFQILGNLRKVCLAPVGAVTTVE